MSGYHDGGVVCIEPGSIEGDHMLFGDFSFVRPLSVKSRHETEAILKLGDGVDMKVWIDECSHMDLESFRRKAAEYLNERIPFKARRCASTRAPEMTKSERRKLLKKGGSW